MSEEIKNEIIEEEIIENVISESEANSRPLPGAECYFPSPVQQKPTRFD